MPLTNKKLVKKIVADLTDFFDKNVERYLDGCYYGKQRYPSNTIRKNIIVDFVGRYFKKNRPSIRILDLGCGAGNIMVELLDKGYAVEGVDPSTGMLKHCRAALSARGYDDGLARLGDAYDLSSFPGGRFDGIVCAGVLGYLPRHDLVFAQMRRVLKPGGILICDMVNRLFDLFTLNKHTVAFLDHVFLAQRLSDDIRSSVSQELARRLQVEEPYEIQKSFKGSEIESKEVDIDYHTLNYEQKFASLGWRMRDIRYYHKHPIPTIFEKRYPDLFLRQAEPMENKDGNEWYDPLICSTAVVVLEPVRSGRRGRQKA